MELYRKRIVWDKDFSEFTEDGREFEYAIFSKEENVIALISCNSSLKINVMTGDIISCHNVKGNVVIDEYFRCTGQSAAQENILNEELKRDIFSQLTHFKNCDFRGTEFFEEEHME